MRIPTALEEMVAGLISDEQKKREEVEGILSQIHELTAAYFEPERKLDHGGVGAVLIPEPESAPVLSDAERLKNFTGMFERKGLPPDLAVEKAEEILGMRDGSR